MNQGPLPGPCVAQIDGQFIYNKLNPGDPEFKIRRQLMTISFYEAEMPGVDPEDAKALVVSYDHAVDFFSKENGFICGPISMHFEGAKDGFKMIFLRSMLKELESKQDPTDEDREAMANINKTMHAMALKKLMFG